MRPERWTHQRRSLRSRSSCGPLRQVPGCPFRSSTTPRLGNAVRWARSPTSPTLKCAFALHEFVKIVPVRYHFVKQFGVHVVSLTDRVNEGIMRSSRDAWDGVAGLRTDSTDPLTHERTASPDRLTRLWRLAGSQPAHPSLREPVCVPAGIQQTRCLRPISQGRPCTTIDTRA